MKKLILCLALAGIMLVGVKSWAIDVSGEWTDKTTNSNTLISQKGKNVTMINSFVWEGVNTEWKATGRIEGIDLKLKYNYTKKKPAGMENGSLQLKRINANTLVGSWTTNSKKFTKDVTFNLIRSTATTSDPTNVDVSGVWSDKASKSNANIEQKKDNVKMTNAFTWEGKEVEWKAKGKIDGIDLKLKFKYTKNKPASWENGTLELVRVDDKTLTGRWITNKGFVQDITFKMVAKK